MRRQYNRELIGSDIKWDSSDGEPIVHATCHCQDCRDLLNIPFKELAAWDSNDVDITLGTEKLLEYKYPGKAIKRYSCKSCGATPFNTNAYDCIEVAQALIRKCNSNELLLELSSDKHFFYEERVVDVIDPLLKYLKGVYGPLHEG